MSKKKKILLLADDLRMHSGIATQARELVLGTCHHYDWVQIAGSIKHPEKNKVVDLSQAAKEERGVDDAYIRLYPTDGYGNADLLNKLVDVEKPDAILHFTDPRFWGWLYNIERDIRQTIPLMYLNIWDDIPYPMWNYPFYRSCDALFSISKQTLNINKNVLRENQWVMSDDVNSKDDLKEKSLLHYVPHGIDADAFKEINDIDAEFIKFKHEILVGVEYECVFLYNNRNIRRKHTADIILAFRRFCDSLPKEKSKKCCLLLHTSLSDDAGTDLGAVVTALCPDYPVLFSSNKLSPKQMNFLYNVSDVVVNMASNEGFGLSGAEALMTETPIINNCTGGLQDHMGFVDDDGKPIQFTPEWSSNHDGRYKNHGKWAKPVYPAVRTLQGSPTTPYIFDDLARYEDFAEAMMFWYLAGDEKRKECGKAGREFCLGDGGLNAKHMCSEFIAATEKTLDNFTPRSKFSLHTKDEYVGNQLRHSTGFEIGVVDIEKVKLDVSKL